MHNLFQLVAFSRFCAFGSVDFLQSFFGFVLVRHIRLLPCFNLRFGGINFNGRNQLNACATLNTLPQ